MNEQNQSPARHTVFPAGWKWSFAAVATVIFVAFAKPLYETALVWINKADYSHGFFVPLFSAWLIWRNRASIQPSAKWPHLTGLLLMALAAVGLTSGTLNIAKDTVQGLSLILALTGLVIFFFGTAGLRWSWPSLLFLIFMYPLPYTFEQSLALKLRRIAAVVGNDCLICLGQPAYIAGSGTVITVGEVKLDVQHACSGLSMLLTFVALATATALLMKNRPPLDRWLIVLSSIPIAVICNIVRIVLTGLVYVWGWNRIGDLVVHDLAGWLMMPLALGFIWIELKLIDWLCVVPIRIRKEEFMRANLVTEAYIRVRKDKPAPEPVAPLRPDGSRVGS